MLSRRLWANVSVPALVLCAASQGHAAHLQDTSSRSTGAVRPAFDVASVKRSSVGPGPIRIEALPGGRFVATNVTLRALIQYAYRLHPSQIIGGPAWLASDRYDIVAKADSADSDQ